MHAPALSAALILEDGRVFRGVPFGARGCSMGEAVFCTGMTGYQETLTDPSYHGQIVVQTAPHVGNTGWNDEDDESTRIQVAGYAVRDPATAPSNWRSRRSLAQELERQGVVGVAGVDTRALTRHIREHGAMRAGIFSGRELAGNADSADSADSAELAELAERVRSGPLMAGADLAGRVGTQHAYVHPAVGAVRFRVAALDLGVKANSLRMMAERGIESHVLPPAAGLDEVLGIEPDGVFLSNGPGDPAAMTRAVSLVEALLGRRIPVFGICLGSQLLGRALGRGTYKMRYGHRGVNIPVLDAGTGRVAITAHNHGFAVEGEPGERFDTPFGAASVSHHCPNDGTVEGLRALEVPAFSVQYHPEAAAGPHDASALFDRFTDLMKGER